MSRTACVITIAALVMAAGCAPSAEPDAAGPSRGATSVSQQPTDLALTGEQWQRATCEKLIRVVEERGLESTRPPAVGGSAEDVGAAQAWLAKFASYSRAASEALATPLEERFTAIPVWMKFHADQAAWNATWADALLAKLASLSPGDAAALWSEVADEGSGNYDAQKALAIVPAAPPIEPSEEIIYGEVFDRESAELNSYLLADTACDDAYSEVMSGLVVSEQL